MVISLLVIVIVCLCVVLCLDTLVFPNKKRTGECEEQEERPDSIPTEEMPVGDMVPLIKIPPKPQEEVEKPSHGSWQPVAIITKFRKGSPRYARCISRNGKVFRAIVLGLTDDGEAILRRRRHPRPFKRLVA